MQQTTLQYRATTSKAGCHRLDQALLDMGLLYNALILHRKAATSTHRRTFSLSLQTKAITDLRREDPTWATYDRRLMEETAKQTNRARAAARTAAVPPLRTKAPPPAQHRADLRAQGYPPQGGPRERHHPHQGPAPYRVRAGPPPANGHTATHHPRHPHPTTDHPQPGIQPARGTTSPAPEESVGIDPGVHFLVTAVGNDDDETLQVPGQDDRNHRKTIRRLRRKMQRQRDSALKDSRARWTNQKTQSGSVKRRFRWVSGPSNEYLKCNAQLRRVEQKRRDSLRGIHHRVSSHLVNSYQTICLEDTKTANLTRSARGTVDNPGTNVRQKTGINRSILSQGWYLFRQKLEYKCRWHGRTFVPVPAQFTSQACSQCGNIQEGNRTSQSAFRCLVCGYNANADVNAAQIIRRQGLALVRADESPERAAGGPKGPQARHPLPTGGSAARRNADQSAQPA